MLVCFRSWCFEVEFLELVLKITFSSFFEIVPLMKKEFEISKIIWKNNAFNFYLFLKKKKKEKPI